jgi:sec-independent protein translocase protein TatA
MITQFASSSASFAIERAMFGTTELLLILAVVVLLFGANKLPQLGKGLGEAIGNFKKAKSEGERAALTDEVDATPRVDGRERISQDRHG